MELKRKNKEIERLKSELKRERDISFRIKRELKDKAEYWERKYSKERDAIDKERLEKKREEIIRNQVKLMVRTEEEEKAKICRECGR